MFIFIQAMKVGRMSTSTILLLHTIKDLYWRRRIIGGHTMAGISDKALKGNYDENKVRFNGKELQNKEFSDRTGLEEYDFGNRFYDQWVE
ncbi:hypothetical protein [Chitinophaga sp. LS1]|uniref:hypothetical protein n=1 Tax=Chitinophaga sp. LS1 TaxID=3051176 RepID=UPI002AAB3812|nr:hypothetical protein [Chitinophaga sp. LS1]WPV69655.1 hypothetical protein QQL36_13200 [Chitinophaga sp. LS1]